MAALLWSLAGMSAWCAALPAGREESASAGAPAQGEREVQMNVQKSGSREFTVGSSLVDVIADPAFGSYGRLLLPLHSAIGSELTVESADALLPWYSHFNPRKAAEVLNYLKEQALLGRQIFYSIYTPEEQAADPRKGETGLFYFRGRPGAKTALLCAGGGFMYVGALHDSFPQALELSKLGYNALALIYRPDARQGCEDLARAIAFVHEHSAELGLDPEGYSLWGGSAGARLAAWLGSLGTARFGERSYPQPAAVIMQYTGFSEVYGTEPPTYNCVGRADRIAPFEIMQRRIELIKAQGTPAQIEIFPKLPHGFGLGEGTVAEGWLERAAAFWEHSLDTRQDTLP